MKLSSFDDLKLAVDDNSIKITGKLLKKCQSLQLQITDDITKTCEKHNIYYTLGGGSALGAVRHHGMIPWDDDIDLNILRKDCDSFVSALESDYPGKYWIHTPEYSKNYGLLFIQVRLRNTIMRGREDMYSNECGIGLDVFPYENTYNNKIARTIHGILCLAMKFALSCRKSWAYRELNMKLVKNNSNARKTMIIKCIIGAVLSVISIDTWTHGTIKCCKMCKNDNTKYVVIPSGRKNFFGEIYERNKVLETEYVPFEGRQYKLMKHADGYLKQLYGDYMAIPPESKREHHVVYELDFGEYDSDLDDGEEVR